LDLFTLLAKAPLSAEEIIQRSGGHLRPYTYEEIADDLTQAGFGRIKLINPGEKMDGLIEAYKL
jgi:hypothetical protein